MQYEAQVQLLVGEAHREQIKMRLVAYPLKSR